MHESISSDTLAIEAEAVRKKIQGFCDMLDYCPIEDEWDESWTKLQNVLIRALSDIDDLMGKVAHYIPKQAILSPSDSSNF